MTKEHIKEIMHWVEQCKNLSVDRILLGSNGIPKELRSSVATQIGLRDKLRQKLPTWAGQSVYIPKAVNLEQASSEEAARYKACFVNPDDTLLDLTGGMAVDFTPLSCLVKKAIYVEQDRELFDATLYNLANIKHGHCVCYCLNSMEHLDFLIKEYSPSIIYIDPARREAQTNIAKRTYAIEDCSPNLYELIEQLQGIGQGYQPRIVAKLSPMLDVKYCLDNVPKLRSLHILAVHNEVKELILELDLSLGREHNNFLDTELIATDLYRHRDRKQFRSKWQTEEDAELQIAKQVAKYVYEPNGAMMKLGLFKAMSKEFEIPLLHSNSHVYTSEKLVEDFSGRCLELVEIVDFSSSNIRQLNKRIPQANVICRNFSMKADVLTKKLKIKEGGDKFILATTLADKRQVLLICYLCGL